MLEHQQIRGHFLLSPGGHFLKMSRLVQLFYLLISTVTRSKELNSSEFDGRELPQRMTKISGKSVHSPSFVILEMQETLQQLRVANE